MTGTPVRFVVGTGRCGSTALSRVLNLHPEVLSVNELLSSLAPGTFPDGELTGAGFWKLLAEPNPIIDAMLRDGTPVPELLYRRGRFAPGAGVPVISAMVLPHLTDDPDGLFDELADVVPSWPSRPISAHYEGLFAWLCDRFGRRVAIERSGFSLQWITTLVERFPAAKLVHMVRDGPDCALSMSRHPGFRLVVLENRIKELTGVATMPELTAADIASLPPGLAKVPSASFDPAVLAQPLPLAEFGDLWSRLVTDGVRDLAPVPAPNRLTLSFEDLIGDPRTELTRFAGFAGVDPIGSWLDAGRALLDRGRLGGARSLPPDELAELRERCAPGARALEESL
ncbi:sulfotransferase [Amycolatopsis minnesotensis]|uniref:Sulfotransferase n=1 Tax=Amycolatopsis minnesotensis TaxID=337894 RepID=A0ABP5DRT1_9PSEU